MALSTYSNADVNQKFSTGGTNTKPIRHSIDGRIGGVIEKLYYVRNDDLTKVYTSVSMLPVANIANDIVSGDNGYSVKLKAGSAQPTAQEWAKILPGNTITFANITDTVTFHPFWIRMEIPKGAPVQTVTDTVLRISATEGIA